MIPSSEERDDVIRNYVAALFEPRDLIEVRCIGPGSGHKVAYQQWMPASDLVATADLLQQHNDDGFNIFAGVLPRKSLGTPGIRAKQCRDQGPCGACAQCVLLSRCLFADFDGVDVHEARQRIEPIGLPPALLVDSGHGIHAYWPLRVPVLDLNHWQAYQKELVARLKSDPRCTDPPRILRLPGFLNCKAKPFVPCRIIECVLARKYTLKEFSAPKSKPRRRSRDVPTREAYAEAISALDRLHTSRADEYGDWIKIGMILHSIDDGAGLLCVWDEWSRQSSKWREGECAKKWATFNAQKPGGVTLGTLVEMARSDSGDAGLGRRVRQPRAAHKPSTPRLAGPFGIKLVPRRIRSTPTKLTADFAIHVDNRNANVDWTVTDTPTGVTNGTRALIEILEQIHGSKVPVPFGRDQKKQLHHWIRTVAHHDHLTRLRTLLDERDDASDQSSAPTVFEIALPYMSESLGLAFVGPDGRIWSETDGRFIDRITFTNTADSELLNRIKRASNYPAPTEGNPTRPIRHLYYELRPCWCDLLRSLPDELHANLGPESKAATAFNDQVYRIWSSPETWLKRGGSGGSDGYAERMSLASRVRELSQTARTRGSWMRVLTGAEAYFRVEPSHSLNDPRVLLGMCWELCRGQIKGVNLAVVTSQSALKILATRYGLASREHPDERVRCSGPQRRTLVLDPHMCERIVFGIDDDDRIDAPRVSHEEAAPFVTGSPATDQRRPCRTEGADDA